MTGNENNICDKIVFWHRELPPLDGSAVAEHMVEATSARVPGTLLHREELWDQCYEDVMAKATARLEQEVLRLEGHYATFWTSPLTADTMVRPTNPGYMAGSRTCCIVSLRQI